MNNQRFTILKFTQIDGKKISQRDYLKRVSDFNIQIDNLCQFLPQDRVQVILYKNILKENLLLNFLSFRILLKWIHKKFWSTLKILFAANLFWNLLQNWQNCKTTIRTRIKSIQQMFRSWMRLRREMKGKWLLLIIHYFKDHLIFKTIGILLCGDQICLLSKTSVEKLSMKSYRKIV